VPGFEAPDRLREAIRLVRVVNEDGALRKRGLEPVADAEIGADEDERPADGPPTQPWPNGLDGIPLPEERRRLKPAPQTRLGLATEDFVHLDRTPVASALRIPEGIDHVHRGARGGVRRLSAGEDGR